MPSESGHSQGVGDIRIEVDPEVLIRAGQRLGLLGTQLDALMNVLRPLLSSGIASGLDPAGFDFGLEYGDKAQEFADALAKGANAFKFVGYKLEASGHNYKNADASSTVGGSGPAGGVGEAPGETAPADATTGPSLAAVFPPAKWWVIAPFVGLALTWPSGNPAMLRVTAEQWRNLAEGFSVFEGEVHGVKTTVSTQKIPEGEKIGTALDKLGGAATGLATLASKLGTLVGDFANTVQETQDAIRRLLDRLLSVDGFIDTVTGIFTGEAEEIIKEVARDVQSVLENFVDQVRGIAGLLGEFTELLTEVTEAFQSLADKTLRESLGDQVGGALSEFIKIHTDLSLGVTTGLVNTVAGTVSMADPAVWQGMAQTAWSVIQDPTKADDVALASLKEFVAYDKLTGDNPARGIGEAGFNVASLFLPPGGALSKTGTVAKGINAARRQFGDSNSPSFDDLPGAGPQGLGSLEDLTGGGSRVPDVPEVRPGGIPDSVIGPVPPNAIDAPQASPRGVEAPAGPPDPPSPTGVPGGRENHGDGGGSGPPPPPDPPERTPGPSDAGPGRAEGPPPQSPASPGPNSADSPPAAPNQAPSPGDPTPPATPQAPESSGPTGQSEAGPSPSDTGSPTGHTPAAPDAPAGGHAPEQHGGGTGVGENSAQQPGGNDAPSEGHRPGSDEHTARPDERTHTPAEQQPTSSPAVEQPSGPERTGDGDQTREPAHAAGESDAKRHEPAGVMPVGMGGFGTPVGSHGSGSSPGAADGSPAAPKSGAPDASTRNLDGTGPRAATPESPRAQQPGAAGPSAGNSPTAPINSASTPPPRSPADRVPGAPHRESPVLSDGRHRPPFDPSGSTAPGTNNVDAPQLVYGASSAAGDPKAPSSTPPPDKPADAATPPDSRDVSDRYQSDRDNIKAPNIPPDEVPPPLVRETPYPNTGGILPKYVGEQYPGGPLGSPGVTYLDEAAREARRITIRDGIVYDSSGKPFDTSKGVSAFGPNHGGRAIFVMDAHGNLYASTFQKFRVFHHSSFLAGAPVAGAGELVVKNGRIELLSDCSGHYQPGLALTQQVLDQLASQGIRLDASSVQLTARPGTI
ncbi:hypothetical protein O6P37_10700 [Mycobacterium sp. CPCC 205372]|uniref:Outer membrane channel protein CpnT-like N-terminal domain-containing protein n=1 Tax=Mycobacterium hippophais TaxID=3016340 RepID=A0ABT4PRZ0_9MYCO|nr:hypothetical protein [Mycobacterium hippophais]MCZ8379334.1 hypothetical protein [Mycobacterium hippophais]